MGVWCEHFQCVELGSEKKDCPHATRHGAAYRCHELNVKNQKQRWTARSCGQKYVPDYLELQKMRKAE